MAIRFRWVHTLAGAPETVCENHEGVEQSQPCPRCTRHISVVALDPDYGSPWLTVKAIAGMETAIRDGDAECGYDENCMGTGVEDESDYEVYSDATDGIEAAKEQVLIAVALSLNLEGW